MSGLYYQYGAGPASMQGPDYQTFLALLEKMRKQNEDAGSGKSSSSSSSSSSGGGLSSLMKMFGGGGGQSGAPSMSAMNGAAGPMVDSPISGGFGGIAGLIA